MTPELAADRDRALSLVDVSRETLDRLDQLVEVLLLWREKANLIASSTIPQIWTRHIADSLQLLDIAAAHATGFPLTWIDLGSGAGFPGLPIACALAGRPGAHVMLVESNARKAAFLREAVGVTGAPVSVFHERIEHFIERPAARADVVTARALSPLKLLLDQSISLLKTGALGVFPKGQDVAAELTEAAKYWNINHILVPSRTDPKGRIVVVKDIERRQA
jgi:16S rRNA (guanine527-N7)-methyltransferase